MTGCPATPLTEPDLWATHPALCVAISKVKERSLIGDRCGCVQLSPLNPQRNQTLVKPSVRVGPGHPRPVAAVPAATTAVSRPGGRLRTHTTLAQMPKEIAPTLLLV